MQLKIRITTPKDKAEGTTKRLKPFLIGNKALSFSTTIEKYPDYDVLYWILETDIRRALKIQRNVLLYEGAINNILGNKHVMKRLKPEDRPILKEMLGQKTKIEIIKD